MLKPLNLLKAILKSLRHRVFIDAVLTAIILVPIGLFSSWVYHHLADHNPPKTPVSNPTKLPRNGASGNNNGASPPNNNGGQSTSKPGTANTPTNSSGSQTSPAGGSPPPPPAPPPAPAPSPPPPPPPPAPSLLYNTDYDSADLNNLVPPWQAEQEPNANGVVQNRITVVKGGSVPGGGVSAAMRVELQSNDVQGGQYNRAEVYARHASPASTPAANWPDPVGSIRWYGFSIYFPSDFAGFSYPAWLAFTQLKGYAGGSPPIDLEVGSGGAQLQLVSNPFGRRINTGAIKLGQWERLVLGVKLATDSTGWVELYRGGALAASWNGPTMEIINGQPDPIYLKQGLYRGNQTVTHVIYFGPTKIGTAKSDVEN